MFTLNNVSITQLDPLFQVFSNISDLVFIMDVDEDGNFRYIFANEPAKIHAGIHEDLVGKKIDDVMPIDMAVVIMNHYNHAVQHKKSVTYEDAVYNTPTGDEIAYYESKVTPFFDDHGNCTHIIAIVRDVSARKKTEIELYAIKDQLSHLAYHDTLTDLPNRRMFLDRLKHAIHEADEFGTKFAVLYLDLDHFKTINDQLGHDVGDQLLIQFSQKVKGCLRKTDILARFGGDEFCALVKVIEVNDVIVIAQKIIEALQNKWIVDQYKFETTSSIGIALYEKGDKAETLIKEADIALYQAKQRGRNNFQIYTSSN